MLVDVYLKIVGQESMVTRIGTINLLPDEAITTVTLQADDGQYMTLDASEIFRAAPDWRDNTRDDR